MDKGVLREVRREELKEVARFLQLPHAVIISGIRRVGKSTLLAQIIDEFFKEGVHYLNFEDERLLRFSPEDYNDLLEIFVEIAGEKKVIFFDEIQNAPRWEVFVRRMQERGYKFFLTGSNASLLSREFGTKRKSQAVLSGVPGEGGNARVPEVPGRIPSEEGL